jgi:hypothetical protein
MTTVPLVSKEGHSNRSLKAHQKAVADVWTAQALKTAWTLLREYKIPPNSSNGDVDFEVRLVHLVLALAATHPKHKKRARSGPKTKWGAFEKAALLNEVGQLQKEGKRSGKKIAPTAACRELAGRQPWKSFLDDVENPSETMRQMYSESKSDSSLENFVLFFAEAGKSGEEERRRRIALMFKKSPAKRPDLGKRLDQLLHGKM